MANVTDATNATTANKLMLIDGHSMAFRAFYALPWENFSTAGGQHTNAVYGFLRMLLQILKEEQPTHVAVAFDVGRKTFRTERFPEYKAQREAAPEPFRGQVDILKQVLATLGFTTVEMENYEADDIIATFATAAGSRQLPTVIVTGDRDSFQLVNDTTTVLYPVQGVRVMHRFTPAAVEEKYGVTPKQYPDLAALRGDKSDNMPGVPGVGEKTALKWISQYGDLENLLEHADDIRGKVGENLRARVDQVRLNRELTEMVKDLALPVGLDDLQPQPMDTNAMHALFDDLQFGTSLREDVVEQLGGDSAPEAIEATEVTMVDQPVATWLPSRAAEGIACVIEGNPKPGAGDADRMALVDAHGEGVAFHLADISSEDEKVLAQWLASEDPKYFHDAKAAWHMLAGRGFTLGAITHDTALAAYLVRPGQRSYSLADVVQRHLQRSLAEPKQQQLTLDFSDGLATLVEQAQAVRDVAQQLVTELQAINAYELYQDLEIPLISVLAQMEHVGIAVDTTKLEIQRDEFIDAVQAAESTARELAGDPSLNLSSPKQLQVVLFETLGMPKTKKTKTGYSTAAKELEQLAKQHPHPFLDALMAHRENQKMKTTLDGLIKAVAPDGRIHTTFNQTVTSTGRLSSTDPNLQNIPVRTAAGRQIRSAFVVGEDFEALLTADYSQIEMRVMAHLSQDAGLIEAYQRGEDLHNYVGSKVFDVPVDQVTSELRRRVKAMSYGLVYGLSAFGLAGQLDIAPGEAKRIMENYFLRFGGVKRFLDDIVEQARKDGYTETLFGRRRYLPELNSDNRVARENAERAALNAPIQGTAADIIKVAMLRVDAALHAASLNSRVLLQVHDELVVEVAAGEMEQVRMIVESEMDTAIRLRVPLEVSSGFGKNWDEAAH